MSATLAMGVRMILIALGLGLVLLLVFLGLVFWETKHPEPPPEEQLPSHSGRPKAGLLDRGSSARCGLVGQVLRTDGAHDALGRSA